MYVLSLVIALVAVLVVVAVAALLVAPARRAARAAESTRMTVAPRLAILRLSLDELKGEISRRKRAQQGRDRTDGLPHA